MRQLLFCGQQNTLDIERTTISKIRDWSKDASVQTCRVADLVYSLNAEARQNTARAHLLMVWHWAEIADVFQANWHFHFDGTAEKCSGDQLLFQHVVAAEHSSNKSAVMNNNHQDMPSPSRCGAGSETNTFVCMHASVRHTALYTVKR